MGHPRVRLDASLRGARRLPLGAALRRLPGRRLGARHAAVSSTSPTATATTRPQPLEPGRADRGRDRARGDLVGLRARAPRTARARGRRLAEHLAAAGRRRPLDVDRGVGRARPPGARRPRRAARRRRSPPTTGVDTHAPETERRPAAARLALRGRLVERESRAVTSTARVYDAPIRRPRRRSGTTAPSASRRTTRRSPGRAARPSTGSPGPEAEVRTEATARPALRCRRVPRRRRPRRGGAGGGLPAGAALGAGRSRVGWPDASDEDAGGAVPGPAPAASCSCGSISRAARLRDRAARVEAAAGRHVDRVRRLAA